MNITSEKERQGEIIILIMALIWGLFPVIAVLSIHSLDPLISLGLSTFIGAIFFTGFMAWKNKWRELKNRDGLKDALWAGVTQGVIYYGFYYIGLRYTSAGNASIIALCEIFFSYLFFHVWLKLHFPKVHVYGSILVLIGSLIVLLPNFKEFRPGDFLILLASFVAPFGAFYQQRARKRISSESILFIRSTLSFPIIFLLAAAMHSKFTISEIGSSMWYLIIIGIIQFGVSKILWVEGIHRITVTKANALGSTAPLITLLFAWLVLGEVPTHFQLLAVVPMSAGVILLGLKTKEVIVE